MNKDLDKLVQKIEENVLLRAQQCIDAGETKDRVLLEMIDIVKSIHMKRDDLSVKKKRTSLSSLGCHWKVN